MPHKDGVQAFYELRKTVETADIPVCIVTGHPEFREVVYERPVPPPEGYLEKPVDENKLVAYAKHIVETHGSQKRLDTDRSSTGVQGPSPWDTTSPRGEPMASQPESTTPTGGTSRYRQYWEEMPCYLSVHDRQFRIVDGNQRFREDFGDRIGDFCYRVYKGREEVCPDCPVEATFADGTSHGSEQLLTTRRGEPMQVMVHTTPIRDDAGEVVAVMEMHTDIRVTKQLQAELGRSPERLAQLFEEVPCFITVQGPDRVIQHANRKFRQTFGLDAIGQAPASRCTSTARSSASSAHRKGPSTPGSPSTTRRS